MGLCSWVCGTGSEQEQVSACTPKVGCSLGTVSTASAHHLFQMVPHRERKYPAPICHGCTPEDLLLCCSLQYGGELVERI